MADVDNLFFLMGRNENALTKSLAHLSYRNRDTILKPILSLVDIRRMSSEVLNKIKINLQVTEKTGITDIEFELKNKFFIILEAKIGLSTSEVAY